MSTQELLNRQLINECILLRHLANLECWIPSRQQSIDDLTEQVFTAGIGPQLQSPELH